MNKNNAVHGSWQQAEGRRPKWVELQQDRCSELLALAVRSCVDRSVVQEQAEKLMSSCCCCRKYPMWPPQQAHLNPLKNQTLQKTPEKNLPPVSLTEKSFPACRGSVFRPRLHRESKRPAPHQSFHKLKCFKNLPAATNNRLLPPLFASNTATPAHSNAID